MAEYLGLTSMGPKYGSPRHSSASLQRTFTPLALKPLKASTQPLGKLHKGCICLGTHSLFPLLTESALGALRLTKHIMTLYGLGQYTKFQGKKTAWNPLRFMVTIAQHKVTKRTAQWQSFSAVPKYSCFYFTIHFELPQWWVVLWHFAHF